MVNLSFLFSAPSFCGWSGPGYSLSTPLGGRDSIDALSLRPGYGCECADANFFSLQRTSKHRHPPEYRDRLLHRSSPIILLILYTTQTPVLFDTCAGCCFFKDACFVHLPRWRRGKVVVCPARFLSIKVVRSLAPFLWKFR